MYMVIFVSSDVTQAEEMLEHWVKAGVSGVTILESSGMQQAVHKGLRDDIGLFVSLRKMMESDEVQHRTLFSAIKDDETLERVVQISTDYVGSWERPDTGVLLVLPLVRAYGLDKNFKKKKE